MAEKLDPKKVPPDTSSVNERRAKEIMSGHLEKEDSEYFTDPNDHESTLQELERMKRNQDRESGASSMFVDLLRALEAEKPHETGALNSSYRTVILFVEIAYAYYQAYAKRLGLPYNGAGVVRRGDLNAKRPRYRGLFIAGADGAIWLISGLLPCYKPD